MELISVTGPDLRDRILKSLDIDFLAENEQIVTHLIREVASRGCPMSARQLRSSVFELLDGIVGIDGEFIDLAIESLKSIGDLIEVREDSSIASSNLIYLGPPRFVERRNGDLIVFGLRPNGLPMLPEDADVQVQSLGSLRVIPISEGLSASRLKQNGLSEVSEAIWLSSPETISAQQLLDFYDHRLDIAETVFGVERVRIIDTKVHNRFYLGRWTTDLKNLNGRFVGRRPQRFGSDSWSYFEIDDGVVRRFIDLPIDLELRGYDEAMRLQCAIDAVNETPQPVEVVQVGDGTWDFGIFFPPPQWLQRRWDLFGTRVKVGKGHLVTWKFNRNEVREEIFFAKEKLWMTQAIKK